VTERTLRETEVRLQAIIDNSPFAIFLKDREGRYRLINRTYADWFSERAEDIIGHTASELYAPEVARPIEENDREVLEKGQVSYWERRSTMATPGIEHILVTKFPVRDAGGSVIGFAGFISNGSAASDTSYSMPPPTGSNGRTPSSSSAARRSATS
jgi:PAS domain S-box-containing protein